MKAKKRTSPQPAKLRSADVWHRINDEVLTPKKRFSLGRVFGYWIERDSVDAGMQAHLAPGERLVISTRFSPLLAWGQPILLLIATGAILDTTGLSPHPAMLAPSAMLAIRNLGLSINLAVVLTNRRLIVRRGVLNRDYYDFFLDRINTVRTRFDPLGSLFQYGTLTIEGQLEKPVVAHNIAAAKTLRTMMMKMVDGNRARFAERN
jgi:hypothetical protein